MKKFISVAAIAALLATAVWAVNFEPIRPNDTMTQVRNKLNRNFNKVKAGGVATEWSTKPAIQNVNMANFRILNLGDPVNPTDAANWQSVTNGLTNAVAQWAFYPALAPVDINSQGITNVNELYFTDADSVIWGPVGGRLDLKFPPVGAAQNAGAYIFLYSADHTDHGDLYLGTSTNVDSEIRLFNANVSEYMTISTSGVFLTGMNFFPATSNTLSVGRRDRPFNAGYFNNLFLGGESIMSLITNNAHGIKIYAHTGDFKAGYGTNLTSALNAAVANDIVAVGPGIYGTLTPSIGADVTVVGAGRDATTVNLPAPAELTINYTNTFAYMTINGATDCFSLSDNGSLTLIECTLNGHILGLAIPENINSDLVIRDCEITGVITGFQASCTMDVGYSMYNPRRVDPDLQVTYADSNSIYRVLYVEGLDLPNKTLIGTNGAPMLSWTNDTSITLHSNLIPWASNVVNIGSIDNPVKHVYVGPGSYYIEGLNLTNRMDPKAMTLYTAGGVATLDWNLGTAFDAGGDIVLDWLTMVLNDGDQDVSLDWSQRQLSDTTPALSIDYGLRRMYETDGTTTIIDWGLQNLLDDNGSIVLDWDIMALNDAGQDTSLNWDGREGYAENGTTKIFAWSNNLFQVFTDLRLTNGSISVGGTNFVLDTPLNVDASNRKLYTSVVTEQSLDWENKILYRLGVAVGKAYDWQNGIIYDDDEDYSIHVINRRAFKDSGGYTIDYENMGLFDGYTNEMVEWDDGYLNDASGNLAIDWPNRTAYDAGGFNCFEWDERTFYAEDGLTKVFSYSNSAVQLNKHLLPATSNTLDAGSVDRPFRHVYVGEGSYYIEGLNLTNRMDPKAMKLYDSVGVEIVDWFNAAAYDTSGNTSIWWEVRELIDSSENAAIDYQNRQAMDADGTSIVLDWDTQVAYDTAGNDALDWQNRECYDADGTTIVTDWDEQQSFDANGVASFDWNNRYLYQVSGPSIVMDWNLTTAYDDSFNESIEWDSRHLSDSTPAIAIDWEDRELRDTDGSTVMLSWSNDVIDVKGKSIINIAPSSLEFTDGSRITSDGTNISMVATNGETNAYIVVGTAGTSTNLSTYNNDAGFLTSAGGSVSNLQSCLDGGNIASSNSVILLRSAGGSIHASAFAMVMAGNTLTANSGANQGLVVGSNQSVDSSRNVIWGRFVTFTSGGDNSAAGGDTISMQATDSFASGNTITMTGTADRSAAFGSRIYDNGTESFMVGRGLTNRGDNVFVGGRGVEVLNKHDRGFYWNGDGGNFMTSVQDSEFLVRMTNGFYLVGSPTEVEDASSGKQAVNYQTLTNVFDICELGTTYVSTQNVGATSTIIITNLSAGFSDGYTVSTSNITVSATSAGQNRLTLSGSLDTDATTVIEVYAYKDGVKLGRIGGRQFIDTGEAQCISGQRIVDLADGDVLDIRLYNTFAGARQLEFTDLSLIVEKVK